MKLLTHRRRLWLPLVAVAAVAVTGGALAAPPGWAGAAGGHGANRTIELREASPQPTLKVVDISDPGLSAGDHVVMTDGVVHADGSPAGSMTQVCTVVVPGASLFASRFDCSGSFELDNGEIIVQGPFVPADAASTLAVTGGTGEFAAARGQVILGTEDDEITVALA
jgi:hypothetical protein